LLVRNSRDKVISWNPVRSTHPNWHIVNLKEERRSLRINKWPLDQSQPPQSDSLRDLISTIVKDRLDSVKWLLSVSHWIPQLWVLDSDFDIGDAILDVARGRFNDRSVKDKVKPNLLCGTLNFCRCTDFDVF